MDRDVNGFQTVRDYIRKGDARFFNFESIIYREGIWGNQFNGGSFHNSDPRTLDIGEEYGFNLLNFANNHTFDWGYGGLISMNSSFVEPSAMAGRQSRRVIGGPGVNALRTNKHIEVTGEQMKYYVELNEEVKI